MKKLLLVFCILQSFLSYAQDPVSSRTSFTTNTVYEKIYLHIDREMYAPGEDVWFKIYLVSGLNNRYINGYKNVYVQLINESGMVVASRLILTYNGSANGDFKLDLRLEEGQYTLRAHTLYQQNFGEEASFLKKIWISKLKEQDKQNKDSLHSGDIDLALCPESGNLVLNASNIVAFKATGSDGYGMDVSGFVIDNTGDTITPLSSSWMGMGKFPLMPVAGRSYHVELDQFPGRQYHISDIQSEGITLQFKDDETSLKFALAGPIIQTLPGSRTSTYLLTAVHKGITLLTDTIILNDFYSEFSYPKSTFPLGISLFTLKDETGSIVAERLVFVQAGSAENIKITTDLPRYRSRSEVKVNVEVDLEEGDSIKNGLSMAVINRDYLVRNGYTNDIRSFLLLDSELKGYIESPASFFLDEEIISSAEKLDLLMMVHGWRSYYWPEIVSEEPEDLNGWNDVGISIKGHLKKLFRDKPIPEGLVKLGPFSASFHFEEAISDEEGVFSFRRLYLKDSALVIIRTDMGMSDRFTELLIDSIYVPEKMIHSVLLDSIVLEPRVPGSFYSENYSRFEAEKKYAIEAGIVWLEEVEVISETPTSFAFITQKEAEAIYGFADHSFKITNDDMSYSDIYDFLESRVPGVLVHGKTITIRGGQTPVFMIDGVTNDLIDPSHIPMGDIDYIEIIKNGAGMAALGSRGADGVIAIYTRTGQISEFERNIPGRIDLRVDGFSTPRKYFSQKFTPETRNSKVPDYRPTLHWEPYLDIENEKAEVDFFTSDFKSDYLILVEGISKKGRICNGYTSFKVN